jgi:hypothetical protein
MFKSILLILILLLPTSIEANEKVRFIEQKDFHISGISIGSNYKEVILAFGNPKKATRGYCHPLEVPDVELFYGGMKIYIAGDEVLNIKIDSPLHTINGGIRVGSKIHDIKKVFGPAYNNKSKNGSEIHYVVKRRDGVYLDTYLIFKVLEQTVQHIEFFTHYV